MNLVWSAATACVLMLGVPVVHAQENTLIEPNAKVVRLAGDFGFTEGPTPKATSTSPTFPTSGSSSGRPKTA